MTPASSPPQARRPPQPTFPGTAKPDKSGKPRTPEIFRMFNYFMHLIH